MKRKQFSKVTQRLYLELDWKVNEKTVPILLGTVRYILFMLVTVQSSASCYQVDLLELWEYNSVRGLYYLCTRQERP